MREIYLDNSATTKVDSRVAQLALDIMVNNYGNPSSLHKLGLKAELAIEKARNQIAAALSCDANCLFFTSGGTEANNTAILGACEAQKRRGNKIITTSFEHSSVIASFQELEKRGFEAKYISPDQTGSINVQEVVDEVDSQTIFVSIMCINNEIGTILPIEELVCAIRRKKPDVIIHCDAVQAFCKIPINLKKLDVDLMTISSHKIHGPKGVGALYIKKGVRIIPLHFGGEQQSRIRPGTESVPLICAFGLAAELASSRISEGEKNLNEVCEYFEKKLNEREGIFLNRPENASPYIRNISVVGYRSEILLHSLEEDGIYVSSGSACAKGGKSHVLKAMGLTPNKIDSALRISFNKDNTTQDIDAFFEALDKTMIRLLKSK
ncbi:MAG: cysteine desulfurase family protein [Oscillospiraceae bacterium]